MKEYINFKLERRDSMRKCIVVSLLLMFLLTGCISIDDGVEELKKPDVYVDDIKITSWKGEPEVPDPEYKEMWYYITNNSEYTLTQFNAEGTVSNGTEQYDLLVTQTLRPGERSADDINPGADTLKDVEFTNYTYRYIDKKDKKTVEVQYDVKLDKYKVYKHDEDM